ncbi:MFS transporter, partial [Pyxidicoccus sp. 3LG]
ALAVLPLLLALSLGRSGGGAWAWSSWRVLGLFALAAVGTVLFLWVETHAAEPLLDLRMFRLRAFSAGNAAVFVIGAVFLSGVVFLPLFMVNVVGLSATRSGLTIMPLTLGVVAGNVLSGQLVSKLGRFKALMMGSLGLLVVGFAVMGFTLTPDSTQAEVTAKMVLVGLGLGPSIPLYTLAIQNSVPPQRIGVATSAATFFRQLGMTMGVALLGTVFAATLSRELGTRMASATEGLPESVRAQVAVAAPGTSGEGSPVGAVFQVDEVKARLREEYAAELRRVDTGPGAAVERARVQAEEQRALESVDRAHLALKESFTRAVSAVYRVAILIALLALGVTFFLPEQPMWRGARSAPTPTD